MCNKPFFWYDRDYNIPDECIISRTQEQYEEYRESTKNTEEKNRDEEIENKKGHHIR